MKAILGGLFLYCFFIVNVVSGEIYFWGISLEDFKDARIADIPGANKDIDRLADFLKTDLGGSLKKENCRILKDNLADKKAILKDLDEFVAKVKKDSFLIVMVTTHGLPGKDEKDYFLCPYDADLEDLENTAISMADFMEKFFTKVEAGKSLLLFQTCHSGVFLNKLRDLNKGAKRKEIAALSSSFADQSSWFLVQFGGFFGMSLILGLSGEADKNQDKEITLRELAEFILASLDILRPYFKNQSGNAYFPASMAELVLAKAGKDEYVLDSAMKKFKTVIEALK